MCVYVYFITYLIIPGPLTECRIMLHKNLICLQVFDNFQSYKTHCFISFDSVIFQFSSVQLLSCVQLFATPWTAVYQASVSITNSQNLLKLKSIESVMPSNHLILCRPLLLLPSIFPSIRVFSSKSVLRIRWPKYWSFSFSISLSSGLISFRLTDWIS